MEAGRSRRRLKHKTRSTVDFSLLQAGLSRPLLQDVFRDDELLDLAGPVEDAEGAHVAIQPFDCRAVHHPHATEDLQRLAEQYHFAIDASRPIDGWPLSCAHAARNASSAAASTLTAISASFCWINWCSPIGFLKATRSVLRLRASSNARCANPTVAAATVGRNSSSTRIAMANPWLRSPSTDAASTRQLSKRSVPTVCGGSTRSRSSSTTPGLRPSTSNAQIPLAPAAPSARANVT
jgi:hypothetical protein